MVGSVMMCLLSTGAIDPADGAEQPPVFFAVVNTARNGVVALFATEREARDFVAKNTVNGSVRNAGPADKYTIEQSPPDMVAVWLKMEWDEKTERERGRK
jgi:hypothetical protein